MKINDRESYEKWVAEIARNNKERDGSSARFVAESCIINTENVGDEKALLLSAEPYHDERRLSPVEVLLACGRYPFDADQSNDLRELAVEILTQDIREAMEELDE